VITDCSWGSIEIERKYLPDNAQVKGYQLINEDQLIAKCKDADACLSEYAPFTRKVIESLDRCRIISQTAIGYNNIDIEAAKEKGIKVANVPEYCTSEVADHCMALILSLSRNIVIHDRHIKMKIWDYKAAPSVNRLAGKTLGLMGFGSIARGVAERAKGFKFEIIACDPYADRVKAHELGVDLVTWEELLKRADIVSCHLPLLNDTKEFFNAEKFNIFKKNAVFINTSRGGVINEKDLVSALKSGKLQAAALDVLTNEPPCFDDELFTLDNIILTPHSAFYSEEALYEVRRRSAMNIVNFFEGHVSKINFIV